jgi:hypothetical protein
MYDFKDENGNYIRWIMYRRIEMSRCLSGEWAGTPTTLEWMMMSEREGTTRRGVDGSSFGPTNYRVGSDSFGGRCSGQVYRLVIKYREDGGGALIHKGRGQASNHRLNPAFAPMPTRARV